MKQGARGTALAAALAFVVLAGTVPAGNRPAPICQTGPDEVRPPNRYEISAHVVLLGNLAEVGSMAIESLRATADGTLTTTLRMSGASYAEQAKKKRDYSGAFDLVQAWPLRPDGSADESAEPAAKSSSGVLKTNAKVQSEKITFYPDHAVVVRNDKPETRVEGRYGCILSPLAYLMDHDIKAGETIDIPFILKAVPRIFRMEVKDLKSVAPWNVKAYEIVLYAVDTAAGPDRAPKDVWRKKGNLRIWFCKEGPLRNQMLRMKIKFRWYLTLNFDLQTPPAARTAPGP